MVKKRSKITQPWANISGSGRDERMSARDTATVAPQLDLNQFRMSNIKKSDIYRTPAEHLPNVFSKSLVVEDLQREKKRFCNLPLNQHKK
jgi:hypothetical protein